MSDKNIGKDIKEKFMIYSRNRESIITAISILQKEDASLRETFRNELYEMKKHNNYIELVFHNDVGKPEEYYINFDIDETDIENMNEYINGKFPELENIRMGIPYKIYDDECFYEEMIRRINDKNRKNELFLEAAFRK